MQDRLSDLRQVVAHVNPHDSGCVIPICSAVLDAAILKGHGFDIEAQMGLSENDSRSPCMESVQPKLEELTKDVASISSTMEHIKSLKHEVSLATSPEQEKEISQNLNSLLAQSNKEVLRVKRGLEELKEENFAFSLKNPNSAEQKMRENLHAAVTRKFRAVLKEYQTIQTDFKTEVRDKVIRQVKIVFPDATDAEVGNIVDEGDMSTAEAVRMQMTGQTHESLKNTLADLQDKYRDIKRLEQSVGELHQMFVDLATLVDAQSELLDQIDFSVNAAKDYTEKGEKELVNARKDQKKAKKRMCWISVCISILAVIIVIPIIIIFNR